MTPLPETKAFPSRLNRGLSFAGALLCVAFAAALCAFAFELSWWRALIPVACVPPLLLAALHLAVMFRFPRRYAIEVTASGIAQPGAPRGPSLQWTEVTRVTPAHWGGFWLSDDAGTQRIRVIEDMGWFVEALDLVLERGSIPAPTLPWMVTSPRWLNVLRVVASVATLSLLVAYLLSAGPTRLFWLSVAVVAWGTYEEWAHHRKRVGRVVIEADSMTLITPAGETVVSLDTVRDVVLAKQHGGFAIHLVRQDGSSVVIPPVRAREMLRVYQVLRGRRGPRTALEPTPTEVFAKSRRQTLIYAAIAAVVASIARACARVSRRR